MDKVLIAEDEDFTRHILAVLLRKEGYEVTETANGREAVESFRASPPTVVLLDLQMPGMDGIEAMGEMKKIDPAIPVIFITAHGDISTAVSTMKLGAYDFLVKPVESGKLIVIIKRAIEKLRLERDVRRLNTSMESSLQWMLGRSDAIKKLVDQMNQVATSDFSIIIQGETGTGKSYLANIIHTLSRRSKGPFVKVDLGAIPETLVESELFGYERGAFTGASTDKEGFFEVADGGTILIDELENLSPFVQSKLLSVVENRVIYPLGKKRPVEIDVRIIAATNKDIKQSVAENRFRNDLFFRLGEFILTLLPLRERVEDIPFFAEKFINEACSELNKKVRELDAETMELLMQYNWPGNVRELKNVMRRAVLLSERGEIRPDNIEFLAMEKTGSGTPFLMTLKDAIAHEEKKMIIKALEFSKGNKTKAADVLKIDAKTLRAKIREYGIE